MVYRYYETVERAVRYRFGHRLSYTTFAVDALTATLTGIDTATVELAVSNTGVREGKYVVQVYGATTAGAVRRPAQELRAFTKIKLAPSETRIVTVELDRRRCRTRGSDASRSLSIARASGIGP
ncbi:fibronectin type III-like domain-contianing protein [Nocardia sp. NBC_01730]|uniref:fibronectin type III-like domain-contianing protein n=1 Tax=Nocardia sp. NBC_01730 TaxID=2975998 RepID=UPI002E0F0DE6|nr:fibronectin type III-like domain-contianing protein [Nocardia sp. NBC_01730]